MGRVAATQVEAVGELVSWERSTKMMMTELYLSGCAAARAIGQRQFVDLRPLESGRRARRTAADAVFLHTEAVLVFHYRP